MGCPKRRPSCTLLLGSEAWLFETERARPDHVERAFDVVEDDRDVHASVRRRVRAEAAGSLLELTLAAVAVAPTCVQPRDGDVHETLKEVALFGGRLAPLVLELLVGLEVLARADQLQASLQPHGRDYRRAKGGRFAPVATILLVGVDLFFRSKLEGLCPAHRFVTTDSVDEPDLVITDISRVEPEEVADEWPDVPILGFTNHTDRSGLQRGHKAGFDRVIVKSALVERAPQLVDELTGGAASERDG
jgi:hypothetical protein